MYELIKKDGLAKRGRLHTVHGVIETPVFMNVGTAAAIKGAVATSDLQECQSGTGFASCGVAVKAEEHFSGVLAFRKETVKGFARNAAQRKIASALPILRIKADKR